MTAILIIAFGRCTGYAEITMAEVLGKNGQTMTLPLISPRTGKASEGTVSIAMDELKHQHDLVTLKLRAVQVGRLIYCGIHTRRCVFLTVR